MSAIERFDCMTNIRPAASHSVSEIILILSYKRGDFAHAFMSNIVQYYVLINSFLC